MANQNKLVPLGMIALMAAALMAAFTLMHKQFDATEYLPSSLTQSLPIGEGFSVSRLAQQLSDALVQDEEEDSEDSSLDASADMTPKAVQPTFEQQMKSDAPSDVLNDIDVTTFMETFLEEKSRVRHPLHMVGGSLIRSCLLNFTAMSDPLLDTYADMNPQQQRKLAEKFWIHQQGKLWMQHSRKGGGTSLCMSLRLNIQGLIKTSHEQWAMPKRETCQMPKTFCNDCDLTANQQHQYNFMAGQWQGWHTVPRLVDCATDVGQRNFMEMEGTVSPPNLRTHPEWANYVMISTLRHPIARIISSLHNDNPYTSQVKGCVKPENPKRLNHCAHAVLANATQIMRRCNERIYFCYSNYYVRMFAGHPNGVRNKVTRETLENAKLNFLRYSCVVLQEDWDATAECLSTKLGLHLTSASKFNVLGGMKTNQNPNAPQQQQAAAVAPPTAAAKPAINTNATFLQSLKPQEYELLLQYNRLDMEFYDWAKQLILDGYFIKG